MRITQIGFIPENKLNSRHINKTVAEINAKVEEQLMGVPDTVFEFNYVIDGIEHRFNLKPLLEIDVHELSELTLNNLRVQIEKIGSIRFTLERAYEQMMEDYGLWLVNYDVWWSNQLGRARDRYWTEQTEIQKRHELAKSGMKAPTQDDLLYTALSILGICAEYQMKKQKHVEFQRKKSLFEKIDEILQSRSYELKTIIESRIGKG